MNGILALLLATVQVSAAASLQDVLRDIAARYTRDTLVFNFAGSNLLARQIAAGAPVDVFISADEATMDQLQKQGLVEPNTRRTIASNSLVIVVPSRSRTRIRSPQDLARPEVKNIAVAQPETVPAGIYAREYLAKIGVWDRIASRVVPTANVRAALMAVASEDADAGIVYKTDALAVTSVRVVYQVPLRDGPRILYPAAAIADSHDKAAAKRFLDYLESPGARAILSRRGFVRP